MVAYAYSLFSRQWLPVNMLVATMLLFAGGCAATGENAVRELGKAGASTVAAAQSSLDTATQGMRAGLERHCLRQPAAGVPTVASPAIAPPPVATSLARLSDVKEARSESLARLRQTYLAFREIEDKRDSASFERATSEAEGSLARWRSAVTAFSGPVSPIEAPPLPAPQRSLWHPMRVMMLGDPLPASTLQASEQLRRLLLESAAILETERDGVVTLQRATSPLRLSNDLAMWRADQLDLSALAARTASDKPQFLRDVARKQMTPDTGRGRQFAERRLAEYLDDEDRALIAVYDAANKALARLEAAHVALVSEADMDLQGIKRSVEKLARATQMFEGAP